MTDNKSIQRVELHLHTTYSTMDGLTKVQQVIRKAAKWGHPAIAITDHGTLQGLPDAWHAAQKYSIKVIYGIEGYFINDMDSEMPNRIYHITLLAKNRTGLKNLYRLVSSSYLEHINKYPLISKSQLQQFRDGLLVGSACENGEVFQALVRHDDEQEALRLAEFYDYLEIQPVCNIRHLIDSGQARNENDLQQYGLRMVKLAEALGKPLAATGNVHFLDQDDGISWQILRSTQGSKDGRTSLPLYFRSTEEMLAEFAYLGEHRCYDAVITAPCAIAAQCEDMKLFPMDKPMLPSLPTPLQNMARLCWKKVWQRYGKYPPHIVKQRLRAELEIIMPNGYDVIYMTARELVAGLLAAGYPIGFRGCLGASFVAYLLGITDIDPLPPHYRCPHCHYSKFPPKADMPFDLASGTLCGADLPDKVCPQCGTPLLKEGFDIPYETFLGQSAKIKFPNVVLTFPDEYLPQAITHLNKLFGKDHVIRTALVNVLSGRSAECYVEPYQEKNRLRFTQSEKQRIVENLFFAKYADILHSSGFAIVPQNMEINDFSPVQYVNDVLTTQFESHAISTTLWKIDLLGRNTPSRLHQLQTLTGVDTADIPLDDADTLNLFYTGDIDGLPEFESDFTRRALAEVKPECFSDLVMLCGFIHGTGTWAGGAEELCKFGKHALRATVSTRDDVFHHLREAGMTRADAYRYMEAVRLGRAKRGTMWEGWEEDLLAHGISEFYISQFKQIDYLFPRAHAVGYMVQEFRLAWYKAHFPQEFQAVCISHRK